MWTFCDWSSSHSKFSTNHKMSTIWFRMAFVQRVFCSCPRGLSCAVGLRNYAVFPSFFPCLWEAHKGLGGSVRYSATFFVFLVGINTWRHPTPYGSALNGGIPFSMRAMWCCSPLLMAGGKDMSLPVFIPLNVVMLFMFVPTPFLQGFGLT
jgi:hypothetical protein